MRVAVTGATGFLGLHLLRELLDRHRTITVLSHAGSRGAIDRIRAFLEATAAHDELIRRLPERLRVVEIDLVQPRLGLSRADFASVADSIDVLWHCAGNARIDAPLDDLRAVNVEGTRNLLHLAAVGRRRPRVLHISSAYVAGARREGVVKEEFGSVEGGFENDYERSKYEAEVLVREWAGRHRRPVMILRPTTLVSDVPGLRANALRYLVERAATTTGCAAGGWAARLPARLRPTLRLTAAPAGRLNFMPAHEAARVMTRLGDLAGSGGVDIHHVRHPHDVPVDVVREVLAEFLPVRLRFVAEPPQRPSRVERLAEAHTAFAPYLTHCRGYDDSGVRALLGEPRSAIGVDRAYLVDCVRPGRGAVPETAPGSAYLDHDRPGRGNSAEIGAALRFRGVAPAVEDLRQALSARLWRTPVLTYRTRDGVRRREALDLDRHVHTRPVGPGGLGAALDEALAERLPRDRPLWEARLVHGHARDEWAFVFKAHHALLDGASVVEVARRLFGVEPIEAVQAVAATPRADGARAYVRRVSPLSGRPFVTRSLTGTRRTAWVEVDAEHVHAVGRAYGVRVDDVFLAALAGALRDCPGVPWRRGPRRVWALTPSAGRAAEPGNHVRPVRVRLPCDEADPALRPALVARARRAAEALGGPLSGDALSEGARRRGFRAAMSPFYTDVSAGHVRWPGDAYAFRGWPLSGVVPFGVLPRGRPFGFSLATFEDTMCVGVVVDDALPEGLGEELCAAWSASLDATAAAKA